MDFLHDTDPQEAESGGAGRNEQDWTRILYCSTQAWFTVGPRLIPSGVESNEYCAICILAELYLLFNLGAAVHVFRTRTRRTLWDASVDGPAIRDMFPCFN